MQTAQETLSSVSRQVVPPETGQHLILRGVSWATYERLLTDFQDSHAAHFAYDRGVLEIMVLSTKHEEPNRTLSLLVDLVAGELEIDVRRLGSTTFTRADLSRGFEPNSCFYIQNVERVRGKEEIDLSVDPPPDLVIEIDITSPSLNKFPIYAAVGIPEVWRYDGSRVQILRLEGGQYGEVEQSIVLPSLTGAIVTQFLKEGQELKSTVWIRRVQEWARQQKENSESSR
jgi:Uma2 family endonuclease